MTSRNHVNVGQSEGTRTHSWECESTTSEDRKLAVIAASLPQMRYRSALEAGPSIGGLTELLAVRCDRLLWSDLTPDSWHSSGAQIGLRCGAWFEGSSMSGQWQAGLFDLVVLNEVILHFDGKELGRLIGSVLQWTALGAHVVAVHSRHLTDSPLSAEVGHRRIAESEGFVTLVHHVEDEFVLDVWERW